MIAVYTTFHTNHLAMQRIETAGLKPVCFDTWPDPGQSLDTYPDDVDMVIYCEVKQYNDC